MPRYSISNAPREVVGLYAGSGVFSGRLGDIYTYVYIYIYIYMYVYVYVYVCVCGYVCVCVYVSGHV